VIGEYLQPGAHDDDEEEEAQQMCPADEGGHPRRYGRGERDAGVAGQESATGAAGGIELGGGHHDDRQRDRDSREPPDRDEPAPETDMDIGEAHPRMDALLAEQPLLQELGLKVGLAGRGAVVVAGVGSVCHR